MSDVGQQLVDEIQQDLGCPQCQYNLRGLRGVSVHCPECGVLVDVAALVKARWTKPWFKAPGFNRLLMPVTIVVLGLFFLPLLPLATRGTVDPAAMLMFGGTALIMGWAAMVIWIGQREGAGGVGLALLAHVLLAGYIGGLIGIFSGVAMLIGGISERVNGDKSWDPIWVTALGAGMVVGFIVIMWACRRGEKFIAGWCIERYLSGQTTAS